MATAEGLMGVGVGAEQALRTGWTVVTVATDTAAQGASPITGQGNKLVIATPASGDDAVTLPSNAGLGDEIIVFNDHATNSLDVFPASGGSINSIAENGGVAVAAETSRRFIKVSATRWIAETDTELSATS